MFEIQICPLKKLYQLAQDGDMRSVAVLAVSSYDIQKEYLEPFCAQHCMHFSDVVNSDHPDAFTIETAESIVAFVNVLPEELDTLFVCCDSGESRSTAMAAAIMRYYGDDEIKIWENPHYHPNPLVYVLLCEALGIFIT